MSDEHPTRPYPEPSAEHPTLVIPGSVDTPPLKRRRWPLVLLIVVIALAALLVAAEALARAVLPGIVRGVVIEQLDLPADQQIDVESAGILLPQIIGGRLDELRLSTESVTLGGITAAADFTANGVPLHGGVLTRAYGTVRVDEAQFTHLVASSGLPIEEITFAEPDVTASGSLTVFGLPLPVSLTVTPQADAGELVLTPVELQVSGLTLNASQIEERFGSLAEQITEPQRICIADQLPAGLTMTALGIDGSEAVIDVSVDPAMVSDDSLHANGVCP